MPEISVIVPVYNVENTLNRCIDSIISQTFQDYEIVLVDDGSPDSSSVICDYYAMHYNNIHVIHKENGGLSSARLAGYESARGSYICFVDSDDYITEDYLSVLYNAITNEDCQMAMCGYNLISMHRSQIVRLPFGDGACASKEDILQYIYGILGRPINGVKLPCFVWNKMYKKELIESDYFMSERKFFMEDHVFNLLYAKKIKKIAVIDKPLYCYTVNLHSLTNRYRINKWEMYKNLIAFMREYVRTESLPVEAEKIILESGMHWLIDALDNTTRLSSYSTYKCEIKNIWKDKLVQEIIQHSAYSKLHKTEKITCALVSLHFYFLYYLFRKWRQHATYQRRKGCPN